MGSLMVPAPGHRLSLLPEMARFTGTPPPQHHARLLPDVLQSGDCEPQNLVSGVRVVKKAHNLGRT